jgi:hypothetical protein
MGERPDETLWTQVTGSITLSNYTVGDVIDKTNFDSFSYGGVSLHLPMFTISANDLAAFSMFTVSGMVRADAVLDIDILANIKDPLDYPATPSSVIRLSALEQQVTSFSYLIYWFMSECYDYYARSPSASGTAEANCPYEHGGLYLLDEINRVEHEMTLLYPLIKVEQAAYDLAVFDYESQIRSIMFLSDSDDWAIKEGTFYSDRDFGYGLLVTNLPVVVDSVPEPSTLAIFALGLMGLASRRFKKTA